MPENSSRAPVTQSCSDIAQAIGRDAAQQRAERCAEIDCRLQRAKRHPRILLGDDRDHQRGGRCNRAGEHTVQNAQQHQLLNVGYEYHQHHQDRAGERGSHHHQLAAITVRQHAPDGSHDGKTQRHERRRRASPQRDLLSVSHAKLLDVIGDERQDKVKAEDGNELGNPDGVKRAAPMWHGQSLLSRCQLRRNVQKHKLKCSAGEEAKSR